ncbi:hypothetical protein BDY19DRAFT_1057237 [Irpex rosettiformis]|uniref:Uncharacterized protein n=1 Tax=Irpex rosettiformis TaxID=378272 RepID=A0ACB8U2V7_9APHY|nr:hypothetical protein BDY19DRAFT_1057237 [Irpex rosettiformis]
MSFRRILHLLWAYAGTQAAFASNDSEMTLGLMAAFVSNDSGTTLVPITVTLPPKALDRVLSLLASSNASLGNARLVCKDWNKAASTYYFVKCTFMASKQYNFERFLDHLEKSQARFHIKHLTLKCVELSNKSSPKKGDDRATQINISTLRHFRALLDNLESIILDTPVDHQYLYSQVLSPKKRSPAKRTLAMRPLKTLEFGKNFRCGLSGQTVGLSLEALPPMESLTIKYVLQGGDKLQREYWNTRCLYIKRLQVFNATGYQKFHVDVRCDFPSFVDALAVLVPSPVDLVVDFGHSVFLEKFGPNLTGTLYLIKLDLNSENHNASHMMRTCPKLKSLDVQCGFGVLYANHHKNIWAEFLIEAIEDAPLLENVRIICRPNKFRGVMDTEFMHTQLAPSSIKAALMAPMEKLGSILEERSGLKKIEVTFDLSVAHTYGRDDHEEFKQAVESELEILAGKYPRTKEVLDIIVEGKYSK